MIRKILCVDDDSISLTISKLLLRRTGFSDVIDTAVDGNDALEYLKILFETADNFSEEAPQLILLDINMPVLNGWEFLDAYMELYADKLPDTKVVILSSTIDPEDFSRAKKYPVVTQFLSKPLSTENLTELKENDWVASFFAA
ncbi:MAG: response regulator [Sediminibacterium sp.]|jgi:CheY-like chemotaxis protein|nr:response regulator [Chitinophagaceae bacterium]